MSQIDTTEPNYIVFFNLKNRYFLITSSYLSLRIFLVHIGLCLILFLQPLEIAVSHLQVNYPSSAPLFPNPFLLKENCLFNPLYGVCQSFILCIFLLFKYSE